MRKLLTILAIISITGLTAAIVLDKLPTDMLHFPKGKEYKAEWAAVDSLMNLGQPKTTLKVVEQIYTDATKTNDYAQMVKAVFYRNGLTYQNTEDAQLKFIKAIEAEVPKAPFPAKQVMLSGLADAYWSYYQNNRWKIQQRTETMDVDATDPATWDAAKFSEKVSALYLQSLQPADSLKRTPVEVFDAVILQGRRRDLRPTLYDLLAHRAADFFKNSEAGLTQSADKFYMDNPRLLGLSEKFVTTQLQHTDSSNFKLIALQILQDLTTHNTDSRNLAGLVYVELERLAYVKEQSILPQTEKDSLYIDALATLLKRYTSDTSSAMVSYTLAQHYMELGNSYSKTDSTHRWKLKEALAISKAAIAKYPESEGALLCGNLVQIIERPALSIQTEQVFAPNKPTLAMVNAKNINKLYLRLVKIPAEITYSLPGEDNDNRVYFLMQRDIYRSWQQTVPNPGDYLDHSYEIAMDGAPMGRYYLIASTTETFDSTSIINYGEVQVSELSYVARKSENGGMDVLVLDRNNGNTIKGATVTSFEREYDYTLREYVYQKGKTYKTDKAGSIHIELGSKYKTIELVISHKGDTLLSNSNHYISKKYKANDPKWNTQTKFFLDRAIYRPGQTVHFKALVFENKGTESRILKGEKLEVIMRDYNYQEIGKVEFEPTTSAPSAVALYYLPATLRAM